MKILVSSCLLGKNTKYNGGNNKNEELISLLKNHEVFPICPEVAGGLGIPRDPCEGNINKILSDKGKDCTANYLKGASAALDICLKNNIKLAILKERSPSCGVTSTYDGSFSHTLVNVPGITTIILLEHDIQVFSEEQLDELRNIL